MIKLTIDPPQKVRSYVARWLIQRAMWWCWNGLTYDHLEMAWRTEYNKDGMYDD